MKPKLPPTFQRRLNLFDSTAIVVGSMIGSGIFLVSADMARNLGSPGWLLAAWAITGVLTVIAALCYGELAVMMPHAGGQYVYLREAYNPLAGFLFGWTLFLVIQTGSIAAVSVAFSKFLGVIFPWFSDSNVWLQVGSLKITTIHLMSIFIILLLTWVNTRGINIGKYVQDTFSYTKIAALLLFFIVGFFIARNDEAVRLNKEIFWQGQQLVDGKPVPLSGLSLIIAISIAMVGSLFAADAWNNVTFASEEIKNPKRTIPLSMVIGVAVVIVLYMLVNYIYVKVLPVRGSPDATTVMGQGMQYASNDRVGTAAMYGTFGESAAIIMAILIMISTFGCVNGMILSGARVYYAMAKDGLFFKQVGVLNSKGVPGVSLMLQCFWACILCLSGTYSNLLDYVIFSVLIFYVLSVVGVFILRRKKPDEDRPYKTWGYPITPAVYIIACTFIMIILLIYKPAYTWPGLIIVILGIPVYYLWKKSNVKKNKPA